MSTISLGRQHPYFWVCNSLLGMSPSAIAKAVGVTVQTVQRWAFGHNPTDPVLLKLKALIEQRMSADSYNNESPREIRNPLHKEWYKLTYKLIHSYMAECAPAHSRPRRSELQRIILSNLPARKTYVIAQLQRHYSIHSITRAAKTAGVIEEPDPHNPSTVIWRDPSPTVITVQKQDAKPPQFVPPRSKRGEHLHSLITIYLGRRHDKGQESVRATRLVAHCVAHGHSTQSIYRAFKDLCLIRETTGFGAAKVTRYALPHLKEEGQ